MESKKLDLETSKEYQIKIKASNPITKTMGQKRKFGAKEWFVFIISILLITDLTILLNIPFLRQIFGFLFLTILPGLLIIQVLKLSKLDFLEKFVLSVGLSISFLMFFGLSVNNLSLALGYETPLAIIPLLISFNIVLILLAIIGYKINKDTIFTLPNPNLSTSEKAFLIVPVLFPALSIFGMHVMNTTDNNIILMFLLFLIPTYVVFVCFFNHKFSKKLYPVVIFSISISLLLLMSLRSNHIIGSDAHIEFYYFQTTVDNLHWSVFGHGTLDACLSISLLPTIYQSILNISPEFLFKILYSLLYSIVPLIIYVLSKKYIGELYGFLAACFFMFQSIFLATAPNARTNTAILFFALAMMVLFNDKIDPLKKRILFIVFMSSCMVSHYSTTYIFFFVMLGAFIGIEILSRKYSFKKIVSLTIVILFFSMIFFWYSQVTEVAFNSGVVFVEDTLSNLNRFFIEESREEAYTQLVGQELRYPILSRANLVLTWCTFIFIGIGVLTMIKRYKEMIAISDVKLEKRDFLKTKFEMEYLAIVLMCAGLLVIMVALPHVSVGYEIWRLYSLAIVILSVCFVIGGMTLSHFLSKERTCAKKETLFAKQKAFTEKCYRSSFGKAFLSKKRFVLKEKQKSLIKIFSLKKKALLKKQKEGRKEGIWKGRKSVEGKNALQARAYLIILLILIPYCIFSTGAIHQLCGASDSIILNSEGVVYDTVYVHDQESYGAKWLKVHTDEKTKIYADCHGNNRLISQGKIRSPIYAKSLIEDKKDIKEGYIYLRYTGVVNGKLLGSKHQWHNLTEYSAIFRGKDKIYGNGGSEIYR